MPETADSTAVFRDVDAPVPVPEFMAMGDD